MVFVSMAMAVLKTRINRVSQTKKNQNRARMLFELMEIRTEKRISNESPEQTETDRNEDMSARRDQGAEGRVWEIPFTGLHHEYDWKPMPWGEGVDQSYECGGESEKH